jgi:hypothetical protein
MGRKRRRALERLDRQTPWSEPDWALGRQASPLVTPRNSDSAEIGLLGLLRPRSVTKEIERPPQAEIPGLEDPVAELADLARQRRELDARIAATVAVIRAGNSGSWSRIGRALGVTKQSAQAKFGRTIPPRAPRGK